MPDIEDPSKTLSADTSAAEAPKPDPPPFEKPKLTFLKPELVKQGGFAEVTGQFLGTFYP